jgi:hypothetical protein
VSDTPRTDEVLDKGKFEPIASRAFSLADHSRVLERELAEARAEISQLRHEPPPIGPVNPNCEVCMGTGYYGDNGPGIKGNGEYQPCDQCNTPRGGEVGDAPCQVCGGSGFITYNPNLNPSENPGAASARCPHCNAPQGREVESE